MQTREELLRAMQSGNNGKSALNMRNENAQRRNFVNRFERLKKEEKKKSKVLVEMEYAVPFNPTTGKPDDQYNADNKFRPTFSAESTAKVLKGFANDNEEAKRAFMNNVGIKEWDTSDTENINETDFAVFRPYWVPRIFSLPTVNCSIAAFTNSNNRYGTQYEVHVEYDDMGNAVGELPAILRGYNLFNDIFHERVKRLKEENPNIAEKAFTEAKQSFKQAIPMSGLKASNWVLLFEVPLTNTFSISADAKMDTKDGVSSMLKITNLTKALSEALQLYLDGSYNHLICSPNFVELDLTCSTKDPGNNVINTSFTIPANRIKDTQCYAKLSGYIRDVIDEGENVEQQVRASSFVRSYGEAEDCAFIEAFHTVFDINEPLLTDKIVLKNAQFISEAFGESGNARIARATANASDNDIAAAEAPVTKADLAEEVTVQDGSQPAAASQMGSGVFTSANLFSDMVSQVEG